MSSSIVGVHRHFAGRLAQHLVRILSVSCCFVCFVCQSSTVLLLMRVVTTAVPVLYPNNVPRSQECYERSECAERSERAEQCSEHFLLWWPRWAVGRGICGQDQHADLGYISCCRVGCHHSKPKSKLTSPNLNMSTFVILAISE